MVMVMPAGRPCSAALTAPAKICGNTVGVVAVEPAALAKFLIA